MRFIGMWHDGFRWSISNSVQVNGSTLPMSVRQTRGLVREVYAWQEPGGNYNYPHLEFESEICVKICFPLWKLPIHPKPPRWPQARGPRAHPVVAKTMFIRCACCLCPITATLLLRMEYLYMPLFRIGQFSLSCLPKVSARMKHEKNMLYYNMRE